MKVKLATQLLSQSVADALKFFKDFEKTAHNAVLQIFPNCKIACCNFHLGQNWFRHIQQHKILSSEYLSNDSEIGKWIKYLFELSYLNPEEVSDGFCDLMSIAPSNKFSTTSIFFDYILENYITSDSNFPLTLWACEPINNPKTTVITNIITVSFTLLTSTHTSNNQRHYWNSK